MSQPLFSIITINLNHLSGLQKTHQSLQEQSYKNFEWIVVDGGSTDGSVEYLTEVGATYISEKDHGLYDAMNKGIELSKGKYLWFMNAGDLFVDMHSLSLVSEQKGYDFIYGDALEGGRYKKARRHKALNRGMCTHHQSMIYRTELLKNLRYDLEYQIAADYDFTFRFLNRAKRISYIDMPLCIFEQGGVSQINVDRGRREQFLIRKKHNVSIFENVSIYLSQFCSYQLRQFFPIIYWRIKKR